MPVYELNDSLWFPPPSEFDDMGIIAIGGDLGFERLLEAYKQGIFPWFNPGEPITWWHPTERMVLPPAQVRVSTSTRNLLNRKKFEIRADTCFEAVINHCQQIHRPGQGGTWLSDALKEQLIELHYLGYAHSIETFENNELVGGLYGISTGRIFSGDSMFSRVSNASKIAFVTLCNTLVEKKFTYVDCQMHNPHLESLGAFEISREAYLKQIEKNKTVSSYKGPWTEWFKP